MLQCAVKNRRIARNVAGIHSPPKVEENEIEILSAEQIADVLTKLGGHAFYPIVALALATGMRRGELLDLQWGDIILDRRHTSRRAQPRGNKRGAKAQVAKNEKRTAEYHLARRGNRHASRLQD